MRGVRLFATNMLLGWRTMHFGDGEGSCKERMQVGCTEFRVSEHD